LEALLAEMGVKKDEDEAQTVATDANSGITNQ
jgi:hypothetical protein